MLKIVLASRNVHKIREIKEILSAAVGYELEILSLDDIGVTGDIEENGTSFEENAQIKASLPASMGFIGIADDSGLSVDALNGEPGVYSARYAGEPCNDQNNNDQNKDNQDQQDNGQNQQQPQNQQGDDKEQQGGERPEGSMSPEQQEALLQAIQAEEDKTQDKLKEKAAVLIRGSKNW